MNHKTRLGLGILGVAAIMGLFGDVLLRETPWGLNILIWTGAMAGAIVILVRFMRLEGHGTGQGLTLVMVAFAAMLAWRDSPTLKTLDALGIGAVVSLAVFRARSGRMLLAGITEYAAGFLTTAYQAVFGPFVLLLSDINWTEIPARKRPAHLAAAGRGLLIAVPLLAVFGGLFMAADAVFNGLVKNTIDLSLDRVLVHGFVTTVCAWSVGGSLRAVLMEGRKEKADSFAYESPSLGIVEIGTALGLLDVLFLCFVIVQFRYFFGGAATVEATTGLTYAEYARHGFFELVTVSLLVLPMLLAAHWLLRKDNPVHERVFRILAGTQIALLFVIMASAIQRMRLYQNEYGLTELRFYTTAFMIWLAVVFIWFAGTVLRGQRQRFAFGALVTAALLIGALHVLNPDAMIVRTNAERAGMGRGFDAPYAVSLSADAVPSLVEALPSLPIQARRPLSALLLSRWTPLESEDWRAASWSRHEAWRAIQQNGEILWSTASWQENERSEYSALSQEVTRQ